MTATTFRRLDRSTSWVRDHAGEITSGGYALVVHVVNAEDDSPCHSTYRSGYDARCGWCYLGANHSTAEHARKVAESHSGDLAAELGRDLRRLMPGCSVSTRSIAGGWEARAQHKVTGRTMRVTVVGDEWTVSYSGSRTSGRSAYGCDSAVVHGYRHFLDFTSDHGPGTAHDYAAAAS